MKGSGCSRGPSFHPRKPAASVFVVNLETNAFKGFNQTGKPMLRRLFVASQIVYLFLPREQWAVYISYIIRLVYSLIVLYKTIIGCFKPVLFSMVACSTVILSLNTFGLPGKVLLFRSKMIRNSASQQPLIVF